MKNIMQRALPQVVIWGAGKRCKTVIDAIREDNCNFVGIVDSDKNLYQKKYLGKWSVGKPEETISETIDYVIISVQDGAEIVKRCMELGISESKIIDYWNTDAKFDFIDANVRKIYELERELERVKVRLENLPYELGMRATPHIQPAEELLEIIINEKKSLSRYGDGELEIMQCRERPWFQKADQMLAERLRKIFSEKNERVIIALANNFGNLECYTETAADGIRQYLSHGIREKIMNIIDMGRTYYDAYVTRPYLIFKDKNHAISIFSLLKKIWNNRKVLLVEGCYAYNGVRNDLFDGSHSIQRIIAPPMNAFSVYDDLLKTVVQHADEDTLVLISLGPTASVLAYDLAMQGIQALDIGQLDNEYEWYIMRAETRLPIPGKCVAEVPECHMPKEIQDETYENQIVARVGVQSNSRKVLGKRETTVTV